MLRKTRKLSSFFRYFPFLKMHPLQVKILQLFGDGRRIELKLREIARQIGERHPQKIKYHLQQLEKHGLVSIDEDNQEVIRTANVTGGSAFANLPIMGAANCGTATALADNQVEGFLKVSKGLLPSLDTGSLFALRARGDSMNAADIGGKNIEDGDYVIVQKTAEPPRNQEVVVSIIDGCANIKRFFRQEEMIALLPQSKKDYPPIFIREDDPYVVVGKVVKVIKQPK